MTLSILLLAYALVVLGFFLYALLNLYHIIRFGRLDAPTYFMTALFIGGFAFILFVSYTFIDDINWDQPLFSTPIGLIQNDRINTGF